MASALVTPWGYTVNADTIPPLMSAEEFETITGGAFTASDARTGAVLGAVSAAIRAYCMWHVSPVLQCTYETQGPGKVIGVPAMSLVSIESVAERGEALASGQYEWQRSGLIRRACFKDWPREWGSVVVDYTAGLDASVCPDIAAVAAQIASNFLAAAPGVSNEKAGDVSISYNQTANGVTGGITLLQRDMDLLAPYALPYRL